MKIHRSILRKKLERRESILILNISIIVIAMILSSFTDVLRRTYQREVATALEKQQKKASGILLEEDLRSLPEPVRRYIRFTGSVGKPKVKNIFIRASGKFRAKPEEKWATFQSEQYNFFGDPERIFYMRAKKMGIPATGLHLYKDQQAIMDIRLSGLFRVVNARGPEMNQGETVTLFNDMCFMAPASLIDRNIEWTAIDDNHVKARFSNGSINVEAELVFDHEGRLLNFISYDRFETADGKTYIKTPWVTPVTEYGDFNGLKLPSKADVIYKRPGGDFCYMKFQLEEIQYNVE